MIAARGKRRSAMKFDGEAEAASFQAPQASASDTDGPQGQIFHAAEVPQPARAVATASVLLSSKGEASLRPGRRPDLRDIKVSGGHTQLRRRKTAQ
jgi:hypothetical protein